MEQEDKSKKAARGSLSSSRPCWERERKREREREIVSREKQSKPRFETLIVHLFASLLVVVEIRCNKAKVLPCPPPPRPYLRPVIESQGRQLLSLHPTIANLYVLARSAIVHSKCG